MSYKRALQTLEQISNPGHSDIGRHEGVIQSRDQRTRPNHTQYWQPTLAFDADLEMELEDISPEHGGNSLRLPHTNIYPRAVTSHEVINMAEWTLTTILYKCPNKDDPNSSQSAKRRKADFDIHAFPSHPSNHHETSNTQGQSRHMVVIPCIDIMAHMWLGFPIHKETERHRGTLIMKDNWSDTGFYNMGMPPNEMIEFHILWHAFP